MGLSFRKSVSVGPFRFNLSGSGVGVSVGVPGFRVGSGPRGNYVHMGLGGIHYRQTLPSGERPVRPRTPITAFPTAVTHAPLAEIESAGAAQIVDSSSEQILEEIRAKRRKLSLSSFAYFLALVFIVGAVGAEWPNWLVVMVMIASVVMVVAAHLRDKIRKTTVLLYAFEPAAEEAFGRFAEWAKTLASARRAWHVAASGRVYDPKYHAGANELVQRSVTTIQTATPPWVKTNVPVLRIGAGRQTLYFLPDRLLVYDSRSVGAVTYRTLQITVVRQRFIEESGAPSDATVVGHTWRYVNRSGGPDRRFNDNPQFPICLYDELNLRTPSGLNEIVQISRSGIGEGFAAAIQHLAAVLD